jgi:hypothetical protein
MKDATRCYVFEYFAADDLPCIGPATMDIGVEVPHGQSGEPLATAGGFPYLRLMLQLGPHKEPPGQLWRRAKLRTDAGQNFRATESRLGPELFHPAIANVGPTPYACYRGGRCGVLNHACVYPSR